MSKLRVGIVGCGLIGRKRAASLGAHGVITAVCDIDAKRAGALAADFKAKACSLEELLDSVDAVVVATTNDQLVPVAARALTRGKHVLLEKPGARSVKELEQLVPLATSSGAVIRVGYNHRLHPAMQKAREILDSGIGGPVMFLRARYGHGGRIGYDREWRANEAVSGGGELIDQGVHLIDLARWYIGAEFTKVQAEVRTFFWDMPVDDNAFLLLTTASGAVAQLHASCTEWKNLFSFEIYTRHTKLHIEGLGGSYGVERLYHYQMRPEMGPPDTVIYEYPGADTSWTAEWTAFLAAIDTPREDASTPRGNLADSLAAMRIVEAAYATRS